VGWWGWGGGGFFLGLGGGGVGGGMGGGGGCPGIFLGGPNLQGPPAKSHNVMLNSMLAWAFCTDC